jgi:DNA-binding LacI/PurR family transcriptional regulator
VRIKDVAERAGVSTATVSRVLNGSSTVRQREQVLLAVAELGYRTNRLASNLRRRKTAMIGVVITDIENPHFATMVAAVEGAAHRMGHRVLLCNTDETAEKQRAYLEVLAAERVMGVILVPSNPSGSEIGDLLNLGIPLIAFDRVVDDPRADAVVVDNAAGTRLATRHLLAAGHRRIGFISGPVHILTGAERLAGYESAMRAERLEPRSACGEFRIEAAQRATEALLQRAPSLTALVVANNLMTIGALRALRAGGMRVPDDVALVAIDDPFWAELIEPPLTTLAQPVHKMADTAIRMLLERIEGRRLLPERVVFDFELCVRGSCGTARERCV